LPKKPPPPADIELSAESCTLASLKMKSPPVEIFSSVELASLGLFNVIEYSTETFWIFVSVIAGDTASTIPFTVMSLMDVFVSLGCFKDTLWSMVIEPTRDFFVVKYASDRNES